DESRAPRAGPERAPSHRLTGASVIATTRTLTQRLVFKTLLLPSLGRGKRTVPQSPHGTPHPQNQPGRNRASYHSRWDAQNLRGVSRSQRTTRPSESPRRHSIPHIPSPTPPAILFLHGDSVIEDGAVVFADGVNLHDLESAVLQLADIPAEHLVCFQRH